MTIWPALLLAPLIALTNLSITYALVTPECNKQSALALNLVAFASLALTLIFTWLAWHEWHLQHTRNEASDAAGRRQYFLAAVAVMTGGFSFLVIFAQWIPQWVLSPCSV